MNRLLERPSLSAFNSRDGHFPLQQFPRCYRNLLQTTVNSLQSPVPPLRKCLPDSEGTIPKHNQWLPPGLREHLRIADRGGQSFSTHLPRRPTKLAHSIRQQPQNATRPTKTGRSWQVRTRNCGVRPEMNRGLEEEEWRRGSESNRRIKVLQTVQGVLL